MSSEISKIEFCKQKDQKTRKKQGNLKDRHLINAKNEILIISGNLISRHLLKVNRITFGMYQK